MSFEPAADPGEFATKNGYVMDCFLRKHFSTFSASDRSDIRQNFLLDMLRTGTLSRAADSTAPQSYLFRGLYYCGISYYDGNHAGSHAQWTHELPTSPETFDRIASDTDSTGRIEAKIDVDKFFRFIKRESQDRRSYTSVRRMYGRVRDGYRVASRVNSELNTFKFWAQKFNELHHDG